MQVEQAPIRLAAGPAANAIAVSECVADPGGKDGRLPSLDGAPLATTVTSLAGP